MSLDEIFLFVRIVISMANDSSSKYLSRAQKLLRNYLGSSGLTQSDVAGCVARTQSWFQKLLSGRIRPSPLMMGVIERVTDGEVPFEAWRPTDDQIDAYLAEISPNRPLEMGADHAPASQAGERAA